MSKDMEDTLKKVGAKVGGAIDDAKDKMQDTLDQAQDKKQDTIDQLKDKLQDVTNQTKENGQDLKDKMKGKTRPRGQSFEDFAGIVDDEFSRLYGSNGKIETVMNFIRNHPVAFLVIVLIGGMIVFKMLKGCCERRKYKK